MSEREERIDAAIRLVLEWRSQAPAHRGLDAALHALAFEFHWPLGSPMDPTAGGRPPCQCAECKEERATGEAYPDMEGT